MVQYHVLYYTKLSLYHLIYQFQDDTIQVFPLCENILGTLVELFICLIENLMYMLGSNK